MIAVGETGALPGGFLYPEVSLHNQFQLTR